MEGIGGLVYANRSTGECTSDRELVIAWVTGGCEVAVRGYFTYEWNGSTLQEVWH